MKYLVTGGAGFIGSNFLYVMTRRYPNDYFVCFDALSYAGDISHLSDCLERDNLRFMRGDIRDREAVFTLFETERFDIIVNFAAETHVDSSLKNPQLFFETNLDGTINLLDASRREDIKLFHQVSTDEVYGDVPLDYEGPYFDENHVLRPSNPYSASKAAADLAVLSYHRTYGLPVTISRSSNNFGRYQNEEKFIPLIIKRAMNDEKIPVYGDGKNIRDWLFVDDHVEAIRAILERGRPGEIYNISAHDEIDNLALVRYILSILGKDDNQIEFVTDRSGHDRRYAISAKKIEDELGFIPTSDFKERLMETIKWYRDLYSA